MSKRIWSTRIVDGVERVFIEEETGQTVIRMQEEDLQKLKTLAEQRDKLRKTNQASTWSFTIAFLWSILLPLFLSEKVERFLLPFLGKNSSALAVIILIAGPIIILMMYWHIYLFPRERKALNDVEEKMSVIVSKYGRYPLYQIQFYTKGKGLAMVDNQYLALPKNT